MSHTVSTIKRPEVSTLRFSKLTLDDIRSILPLREQARSRACDITVGGIYMWGEYFNYTRCFPTPDSMIIRGVSQDNKLEPAFSLPLGSISVADAVESLREWCDIYDSPLCFSAIPEERLGEFESLAPRRIYELPAWADYVYNASSLATLTGKAYNKKRNHVNRFMADNPDFSFERLTSENLPEVKRFALALPHDPDAKAMEEYERAKVIEVINAYSSYPFEGAVLSTPGHGIVAFTVGEVVGDTLHVHIEKMDHTIAGSGETINKMFASMMTEQHPQIRFINRQDAAGDPGLIRAKESYHPALLLKKYNVIF